VGVVHDVGCELTFDVSDEVALALQVAPASTAGQLVDERLEVTVDGRPLGEPVVELTADHGGRIHLVRAAPGTLHIVYNAMIRAPAARSAADGPSAAAVTVDHGEFDAAAIAALRQSRYCPSDALAGFAEVELAGLDRGPGLARSIGSWVFERLAYELGVSGPLDTAVDSLLANAGACRDFAHLTVTLCRALGVPARLVSAYAPGLSPMDFHAVVEARRGHGWELIDPTRLAPRSSLVRIATGRDAADTAFATTLRGEVELVSTEIHASVDGNLPLDDHHAPMSLA
jgi:transglutaminase-like putative cysteine protease